MIRKNKNWRLYWASSVSKYVSLGPLYSRFCMWSGSISVITTNSTPPPTETLILPFPIYIVFHLRRAKQCFHPSDLLSFCLWVFYNIGLKGSKDCVSASCDLDRCALPKGDLCKIIIHRGRWAVDIQLYWIDQQSSSLHVLPSRSFYFLLISSEFIKSFYCPFQLRSADDWRGTSLGLNFIGT